MRSKFLLGLVVMLLMAVPAMAVPISFEIIGDASGVYFDPAAVESDFDATFMITMTADTDNVQTATYLPTGTPVMFYGDLVGTLTIFTDYVGGLTGYTADIADPLYVARSLGVWPASFGLGIYDPALFADPDGPLVGDVMTADLPASATGIMGSSQSFVTEDWTVGGALNLVDGAVIEFQHLSIAGYMPNPDNPTGDPDLGPTEIPYYYPVQVSSYTTPEPSMFFLFGAGLVGLGLLRKKM